MRCDSASASIQPLIVPATVFAASGPRVGIAATPALAVELDASRGSRRSALPSMPMGAAPGRQDEPEAVAADAVHVRVDHGDRRGGADHRFDGIAAFAQDGERRLCGERVRRDRDAVYGVNRVQHDGIRWREVAAVAQA